MPVSLYAALATSLGLFVAYRVGRVASELGAGAAWLSFSVISLLLALFLSFGLPVMVALFCHLVALNERQCFASNDETVWWFALPLVALPAYLACMFVGRSAGKGDVPGTSDAVGQDAYSAGARAVLTAVFVLVGLLLLVVALTSAAQGAWTKALVFLLFSAGAGATAHSFRRSAVRSRP